jgi:hypothetical protein
MKGGNGVGERGMEQDVVRAERSSIFSQLSCADDREGMRSEAMRRMAVLMVVEESVQPWLRHLPVIPYL